MKSNEHRNAIELRQIGFSVKEICRKLGVAQSTVSLWVRNVVLDKKAQGRLRTRVTAGQLAAAEMKKARTDALNHQLRSEANMAARAANIEPESKKILCAFLYWCEGVKEYKNGIAFANSDPLLTRLFIDLLVRHFAADRKKISCLLHLHEYHEEKKQIEFWSRSLALFPSQFRKTYWKPHTGIRKRKDYPGCISVRYYDNILARKVMYIAQEYMAQHTGA